MHDRRIASRNKKSNFGWDREGGVGGSVWDLPAGGRGAQRVLPFTDVVTLRALHKEGGVTPEALGDFVQRG